MNRSIAIGCDHAGFELKQGIKLILEDQGYGVIDKGCFSVDSVDYPDFAHAVATAVLAGEVEFGILMCGSGNGINMTANKHKGIRAALCWKSEIAELARKHNDANILVMPARFIEFDEAKSCVEVFLSQEFEGGRHQKRIDKMDIEVQ
jgi:ribose 5-phosphate isomerase B